MELRSLIHSGIPSYCTANKPVIRALLRRAADNGLPVLLEATANQINQFGGYTGMQPADYREMVWAIADEVGCPRQQIFLGGDHLGPLVWCDLPEEEAMERAKTLVRLFAQAGYDKIHLDTSMRLKDDPVDQPLSDEVIARRGAALYAAAMEGFASTEISSARRPVFIIGSEVPIPGGTQEQEDSIVVTRPEALRRTMDAYQSAFAAAGFPEGMQDVVAVVVQPGVEFGSDEVHVYDPEKATELTASLSSFNSLVLEGHSTDYQPREALRQMVRDGIRILKVGPALTFAYRDALFALSSIERCLLPAEQCADLPAVLEQVMLREPGNWVRHYHGTAEELERLRKYSLSDRCRYYFSQPDVIAAEEKLFANLRTVRIPLGLLHQYMPRQFAAVVSGRLDTDPQTLAAFGVEAVAEDYEYAAQ